MRSVRSIRWILPVLAVVGGVVGVLVTGSDRSRPADLAAAAAQCPTRSDAYLDHVACLGAVILDIAGTGDARGTVGAVRAYIDADPERLSACHDAAHWAARRIGSTTAISALVAADDGSCDFGITHGALEGLADTDDEAAFTATLRTVCGPVPDGILQHNCGHGIGHAIAIRYGGTFPELLQRCAALAERDQEGCVSAVVMTYTTENASLAADVRVDVARVATQDLPSVCDGAAGAVAVACWQAVADLFPREPLDTVFPSMLQACVRADVVGYGFECRTGLGQAVFFRYDPDLGTEAADVLERFAVTVPYCPTDTGRADCLTGLANGAAAWWRSLYPSFDGFPDICAGLDPAGRSACTSVVASWEDRAAGA